MAEKTGAPDPEEQAAADAAAENPAEAAAEDATSGAAAATGGDETAAADLDPATRLAQAQEQLAAAQDQALRAQAEAENVRRRAAREAENARKFALEKFAAELLPVVDSLEKAVEAAALAEAESETSAGTAEGVALALKLFLDVLAKAGIEQLDPLGAPFDPQQHEAMAMVPNPDAEPNSVMEVMQKGYLLNGRLVRAAMVVVSKAP